MTERGPEDEEPDEEDLVPEQNLLLVGVGSWFGAAAEEEVFIPKKPAADHAGGKIPLLLESAAVKVETTHVERWDVGDLEEQGRAVAAFGGVGVGELQTLQSFQLETVESDEEGVDRLGALRDLAGAGGAESSGSSSDSRKEADFEEGVELQVVEGTVEVEIASAEEGVVVEQELSGAEAASEAGAGLDSIVNKRIRKRFNEGMIPSLNLGKVFSNIVGTATKTMQFRDGLLHGQQKSDESEQKSAESSEDEQGGFAMPADWHDPYGINHAALELRGPLSRNEPLESPQTAFRVRQRLLDLPVPGAKYGRTTRQFWATQRLIADYQGQGGGPLTENNLRTGLRAALLGEQKTEHKLRERNQQLREKEVRRNRKERDE